MRKKKIVKRKEIIYTPEQWEVIEARAASLSLKTGTYIKRISLRGNINNFDYKELTNLMNALRIIGGNINQLAKKANEIHSIYADDYNKMKGDYSELCHTLSQFVSMLPSIDA